MKKIFIGSDHAGFELKEQVKKYYNNIYEFIDVGTHSLDSVDYPDLANLVCEKILSEKNIEKSFGVLICGSGQGMAMRANKFKMIRAALCWNEDVTRLSREHNDANVLCLGARATSTDINLKLVEIFMETAFAGGRHAERVEKLCR